MNERGRDEHRVRTRMSAWALTLLGASVASVGCSNGTCPDGFHSNGSFCEADGSDAGPEDAAAGDAFVIMDDAAVTPDAFVPADAWAPDAFVPVDACTPARLYADLDGDGFGDAASGRDACLGAPGLVSDATDCDDARAETYPGATEVCNGVDEDCDMLVDDGVLSTFYLDADGDGFGTTTTVEACTMPAGYAARGGDCNDGCPSCNPDASEICDGLDNDCDALVDDGVLLTFYVDADGDTYGTTVTTQACTMPGGYAARSGDCNDGCASCNPGASEVCDGLDNDCDTLVDDGVLLTFYRDADSDMHGLATMSVAACTAPSGYVALGDDCNDACATCYPGRAETCDGLDNDCNTVIDNGVLTTFYLDCDGDNFTLASPMTRMACSTPARPISCTGIVVWRTAPSAVADCADEDRDAKPGQTTYFVDPISGPRAGTTRPYDYNCDGAELQQYTTLAACLDATTAGWATAVPACGVSSPWDDCVPPNTSQQQACR